MVTLSVEAGTRPSFQMPGVRPSHRSRSQSNAIAPKFQPVTLDTAQESVASILFYSCCTVGYLDIADTLRVPVVPDGKLCSACGALKVNHISTYVPNRCKSHRQPHRFYRLRILIWRSLLLRKSHRNLRHYLPQKCHSPQHVKTLP